MKVGVTLPQFRWEAEPSLEAARRADELGIDGVFVFDHLWPMGEPDRPILAAMPLLGAVAAVTRRTMVGSLVMRVGLVPDGVLVEELAVVEDISGGRLIAGIGTGDRLSAEENRAYGVPYPPAGERRRSLERCARELAGRGMVVWIGAGATLAPATRQVALDTGAAVNVWNTGVASVEAARGVEVTWGGPVRGGVEVIASRLRELAAAGASWAVCAWPESLDDVAEAAARLDGGPE
ncbi:MAG TPA: LLM class flavin-dependent oxidoreductase [Acidimicrobiales bacterium]|nr:LLM class flavin-dependent oxidoreductase [Acidimicrobiales bacterium]